MAMARWRRAAIIVVGVGLATWLGIVLWAWGAPAWALTLVAVVVVIIAVASWRSSARRSRPSAPDELYASDAYSDMQLGRTPPTSPHHDPASSSQIEDPPTDPLRLPPEADRSGIPLPPSPPREKPHPA